MQYEDIDHIRTKNLAYAYWQARGRPIGSPEVDWLAAEATLGVHVTSRELPLTGVRWEAIER